MLQLVHILLEVVPLNEADDRAEKAAQNAPPNVSRVEPAQRHNDVD